MTAINRTLGHLLLTLLAMPAVAVEQAPRDGAALYARYCALCHAPRGQGYAADNAPSLISASFLSTANDGFLFDAVSYGRPGTAMAGFHERVGGPLGSPDVIAIVQHLRSLAPVKPLELPADLVRGEVAKGALLYADHCSSCHGPAGRGSRAVSLSNPVFLATAKDAFVRHAIEHGREGTLMRPYNRLLVPAEIDDITALIRSWTRTLDRPAAVAPPATPTQAIVNPDGPAPRFSPLREGRYVPAAEVATALEARARMVIVDARPTSDWVQGHIPGALPVPYYSPEALRDMLPHDGTWIVVYCACPHAASGKVMDSLRLAGFTNTAVLDEGVLVWAGRGHPMTTGSGTPRR